MKISVVVPAFREGETAAHGLHPLALHPLVHEVVVAAVDCSPLFNRILKGIPKVQLRQAPKRSRGSQMNFGAAASKGDLLLFLHADSRLEEGAVEEMAGAMRDGLLAGGAFRLRFNHPSRRYRLKAWAANLRSKALGMPYGDQGYFVRKDVFDRLGGFKNWPLFEDVDFFDRLKKRGGWVLLESRVATSARRWEKQGYWKATFKNTLWIVLYKLGVPPQWLAKHY